MNDLNQTIEKYIDEIVNEIDYDIYKEGYKNGSSYIEDEEILDNRNRLKMILYNFLEEANH